MVEEFLKYIAREWGVISQAPVTFIAGGLVIGVLIWTAMSWGYGRENSLLKQQVADYKDKLSGASPDQAKARIDDLEKRITRLQPRRLVAEQRKTIGQSARSPAGVQYQITIATEGGCPDCGQYGSDFEQALNTAGWKISSVIVMGGLVRTTHGIGITVANLDDLPPDAIALQKSLRAAGVEFDMIARVPNPINPVGILLTSRPFEP